MLELLASGSNSAEELQHAKATAFGKVIAKLGRGLIELDYQPYAQDTLDTPAIDHPHHIQALLY